LSILKPGFPGFFPPKSPVTIRGLRQQVSLPAIMFNERAASRNSDPNMSAKTPEADGLEADFQVLDLDDATSPSFRWFASNVLCMFSLSVTDLFLRSNYFYLYQRRPSRATTHETHSRGMPRPSTTGRRHRMPTCTPRFRQLRFHYPSPRLTVCRHRNPRQLSCTYLSYHIRVNTTLNPPPLSTFDPAILGLLPNPPLPSDHFALSHCPSHPYPPNMNTVFSLSTYIFNVSTLSIRILST